MYATGYLISESYLTVWPITYTGTGIPHTHRHHGSSATAAPQLPVPQFVCSQGETWPVALHQVLLLAPEAAGSEPPTHLGATGHSRHAAGQCARCECSVWKVGDGWSRLGFHLAVGGRGTASSRAGVRTWRLGCARRARVACRAAAMASSARER